MFEFLNHLFPFVCYAGFEGKCLSEGEADVVVEEVEVLTEVEDLIEVAEDSTEVAEDSTEAVEDSDAVVAEVVLTDSKTMVLQITLLVR